MSKLLILILAAFSALSGHALTLEELEKSYEQKLSDVRLEKDKSLADLNQSYLGALARIETKYQKAGRLDELMLTREEMKDITAGKWPLTALPEKISLDTAAPRKIYLQKRIEIEQQAARKKAETADKMLALLDKQKVDLTKQGKLEQALLADQIKAEIAADADLTAARKLLTNVMSDGTTSAVLRLRRFGDNIEVMVKHDMRGQISLLSPILNVQETDKTIGDTAAKTLGEYVGAKGFDPDPLTIYQQGEKGKEIGTLRLIGLNGMEEPLENKQTALRLSVDIKAEGQYGRFAPNGPRSSAPGAVRIRCQYLIPKSNKVLNGILITQGGTPILNEVAAKQDIWNVADAIGESRVEHEVGTILFYYNKYPNTKIDDATHDYLLIKDFSIEIVRFSAFLVQRFDKDGTELERHDTPEKQPLFIANGELVPTPAP